MNSATDGKMPIPRDGILITHYGHREGRRDLWSGVMKQASEDISDVLPLPGGIHRVVAHVKEAPEHPNVAFLQELLDRRGPQSAPRRA